MEEAAENRYNRASAIDSESYTALQCIEETGDHDNF